jgi:hypothetical protein
MFFKSPFGSILLGVGHPRRGLVMDGEWGSSLVTLGMLDSEHVFKSPFGSILLGVGNPGRGLVMDGEWGSSLLMLS